MPINIASAVEYIKCSISMVVRFQIPTSIWSVDIRSVLELPHIIISIIIRAYNRVGEVTAPEETNLQVVDVLRIFGKTRFTPAHQPIPIISRQSKI